MATIQIGKKFRFLALGILITGLGVLITRQWFFSQLAPEDSQIKPAKIIILTNQTRQKNDLAKLNYSPVLENAARLKAENIFKEQYFAHQSPAGLDMRHWLGAVQYKFSLAGENLSHDFYSEEGVIKNWLDSPSHRENILESEFKEIGVASLAGRLFGRDTVIVVQMFGRP